MRLLSLVLLPGALAWGFGGDYKNPGSKDAVLLSDVPTLTFYQGRMTAGRRASPVPAVACVGGSAGCQQLPDVVQCSNQGADDRGGTRGIAPAPRSAVFRWR